MNVVSSLYFFLKLCKVQTALPMKATWFILYNNLLYKSLQNHKSYIMLLSRQKQQLQHGLVITMDEFEVV